jgi:hypothetical protein
MKKILTMAMAALVLSGSCKKNDDKGDEPVTPTLSVSPAAVQATAVGGNYVVNVTATQAWSAEVDAGSRAWCSVSPASYTGGCPVTVVAAENPTTAQRPATITFTSGTLSGTVTVTQAAASPVLSVTPAALPVAAEGGNYMLNVTATQAWSAEVDAGSRAWCTLSPASYTGGCPVTVITTENLMALQRPATVTFTSGTLSNHAVVTQAAAPLVWSVDKTVIFAYAAAGSYTFAVTGNGTWTAAVNSGAAWCTLSPASATFNGTVTVHTAENTAETARTATVTLTSGAETKEVTVTQNGTTSTPLYAASTQTWTFGDQIWSDAIQIPECNKTSFTNSYDVPDCRNYTNNNITYYYYYNWAYVNTNGTTLCASPWRVPSQADFVALSGVTSAGELTSAWGLPGYAYGSLMYSVGGSTYYWSSAENGSTAAYNLGYSGGTLSVSYSGKDSGFQVRCVR